MLLVFDEKTNPSVKLSVQDFFSNYEKEVLGYDLEYTPVKWSIVLDVFNLLYKPTKLSPRISILYSLGINGPMTEDDLLSYLDKTKKKIIVKPDEYKDVSQLQDVSGLRVVSVKGINNVKDIVKHIKTNFNVISEDDYLEKTKAGYRSYHLQVQDKKTKLISEIQIRTANQDKWATFAHDKVYKMTSQERATFAQNAESINAYMNQMSEYYYKLDKGQKIDVKPKCPPAVEKTIGCM